MSSLLEEVSSQNSWKPNKVKVIYVKHSWSEKHDIAKLFVEGLILEQLNFR